MTVKAEHRVYWISEPPVRCDLSGGLIAKEFVDGRLPGNTQWGCFDPVIFARLGGKYGLGLGQRYEKQAEGSDDAGRWLKVEG
jgi:hypothetical protein